jgi:uncharacterized protein YqeY
MARAVIGVANLFLCGLAGALATPRRFVRALEKSSAMTILAAVLSRLTAPRFRQRWSAIGAARHERNTVMIRAKLAEALKVAMRAKVEAETTTIRMINAAIKQKDIDVARARGDEHISEDEILNLLQSLIKSRRESVELYKQGGRQDLVSKEEAEIALIEKFLPQQLSEEETKAAIREIVAASGASSVKDMGKVMAALKTQYAGRLDMTKASGLVKQILAGS